MRAAAFDPVRVARFREGQGEDQCAPAGPRWSDVTQTSSSSRRLGSIVSSRFAPPLRHGIGDGQLSNSGTKPVMQVPCRAIVGR